MQWLSGRKNFLGACICAIAVICSGYISVVVADTYKLYINKNDDPNNVIEFEESLNVEVKHTPEGMELNIPDVVINMRCISANSSDKTKCRFGVESSTGSSGSSGSSSSSSSSGSSGSSGASSSGSSSSGSSGAGPDDGVVDSVGNCKTSAIQKCLKYDFGSGGEHNRGNTYRSFVIPGQVVSMPFTVVEGKFSGAVQRTFTSVTGESDGAYPRFWLSAEPSGEPLSPTCTQVGGSEGDLRWHQTGADLTYGCELPDKPAVYYFNWARCGLPATDTNCSLPDTPAATKTVASLFKGRINS